MRKGPLPNSAGTPVFDDDRVLVELAAKKLAITLRDFLFSWLQRLPLSSSIASPVATGPTALQLRVAPGRRLRSTGGFFAEVVAHHPEPA